MSKPRVVITGDDLGLSAANNAGIVAAHEAGILTTTCLMMGGDTVAEGIEIAKTHPTLAVGLHIALNDMTPIAPPEYVDRLVGTDGRFPPHDDLHKRAVRSREGRRQIRLEIASQFELFRRTGLAWDHVNTHRHIHRHPYIAAVLFQTASVYRVRTTRIPWDPPKDPLRTLRAMALRRYGEWYGLKSPERSIGRDWTAQTLLDVLALLPDDAVSELYFHPVTTQDHMFAADLPTLLHADVMTALARVTACRGLHQALHSQR